MELDPAIDLCLGSLPTWGQFKVRWGGWMDIWIGRVINQKKVNGQWLIIFVWSSWAMEVIQSLEDSGWVKFSCPDLSLAVASSRFISLLFLYHFFPSVVCFILSPHWSGCSHWSSSCSHWETGSVPLDQLSAHRPNPHRVPRWQHSALSPPSVRMYVFTLRIASHYLEIRCLWLCSLCRAFHHSSVVLFFSFVRCGFAFFLV